MSIFCSFPCRLLICFAMRFDDHKGVPAHAGYFAWTMGGYLLGLTICEVRQRESSVLTTYGSEPTLSSL